MSIRHLETTKESVFPNLRKLEYRVTSDDTSLSIVRYNCIAHAVGENDKWWWPDDFGMIGYDVYWPPGIDRDCTIDAFVAAFGTKGFVPCEDLNIDLELGYEKIAIYRNAVGEPTHAARQLSSGAWTSKLGDWEDIEHATLECLECKDYGTVGRVLKRAVEI